MKNMFVALIIGSFISCTSPTQEQHSEATITESPTADSVLGKAPAAVYNPNLASDEALASLGIDEAGIATLSQQRPFLEPMGFLKVLSEVVGADRYEEVKARLFLPMNLNTTAEADFKQVPKVGDKMAHEFEEYRPYTSIAQFRREMGKYVSIEEIAAYEKYVFVPIDINTASKEEILALPGVGEKMAHEFEEYRPYTSMAQFRREIGKYVTEDELDRLERYVRL